jgi:hypothetical protein
MRGIFKIFEEHFKRVKNFKLTNYVYKNPLNVFVLIIFFFDK